VGEDGATHHGAFDLAALRPVPDVIISSPMDEHELRRLMFTAQTHSEGPFVIRYPRGKGVLVDWRCPLEKVEIGKARKLREGEKTVVISIGPWGNDVEAVINDNNLNVGHYDFRFLKPLDEEALKEIAERYDRIITIEDGARNGGLGSAVLEWINDHGYNHEIVRMGLPDEFVEHGTVAELRHIVGLDREAILQTILNKN